MEKDIKTALVINNIINTSPAGIIYEIGHVIENTDIDIKPLIPQTTYTPANGDKIYIYPDCDIPRFKIKQFCENNSVSLVKYPDKANVKILGEKSITGLFTRTWYRVIERNLFKSYLLTCSANLNNHAHVLEVLAQTTSNKVYLQYSSLSSLQRLVGKTLTSDYYPVIIFKSDESYERFIAISNETNIYHQSEILKKLNTGTVMKEEDYVSIQRLFQSKDADNTKLAVEMMANCDFEKSAVYLLRLIQNYGFRIHEAPNRTHVNFKSLLKFFNISHTRNFYLDDVISTLIQRKLLNQINFDKLLPEIKEDLESGHRTDYLKIKEVEIPDIVLTAFEENILDGDKNTLIFDDDVEEINPHL